MSILNVHNVKITGIASTIPLKKSVNTDKKLATSVGISEKRISDVGMKTSDLCLNSANTLCTNLKIDKTEIEVLVFVSQTPDYKLPVTSTILQNKLGLSQSCICIDIPLGCSGYVYGLAVISSLMNSGRIKKGLLLVGDTITKEIKSDDYGTQSIFGDAGTATILEYDENAKNSIYDLGSDGSGYDTIIIPNGGHLQLNGIDVFNFGVNKIPKVVTEFLNKCSTNIDDIDLFVFHQANKMMNEKVYNKLNLNHSKVLKSLEFFGNTSSATIPLTIASNHKKILKGTKLFLCGFGVGLSWASAIVETTDDVICYLEEM